MQLNKFLKKLIFICNMIAISSCSVFKNTDVDQKENEYLSKYENNINNNINFLRECSTSIDILKNNNIIYFPLDQYDILNQFYEIIDSHANFLYDHEEYYIKIEGHADERGTPEYNIALGERRANSIKLYLQSKGILSKKIVIISYGKEKPVAFGHNETAYSKNRRAVLILLKQQ